MWAWGTLEKVLQVIKGHLEDQGGLPKVSAFPLISSQEGSDYPQGMKMDMCVRGTLCVGV